MGENIIDVELKNCPSFFLLRAYYPLLQYFEDDVIVEFSRENQSTLVSC